MLILGPVSIIYARVPTVFDRWKTPGRLLDLRTGGNNRNHCLSSHDATQHVKKIVLERLSACVTIIDRMGRWKRKGSVTALRLWLPGCDVRPDCLKAGFVHASASEMRLRLRWQAQADGRASGRSRHP